MKSSLLIWRYVVNVKSTSIFVAFLENVNFTNFGQTHNLIYLNDDSETFKGDKFQAEIISTRKMSQGQWMKSFPPDSQSCN